ncbi:MAG TPA: diaminopimelate decarboxylase [Deltaproteobacteria bacterium]|nr:diaminopimelate decarboxylase [Deltaproteobacteria bacterium]
MHHFQYKNNILHAEGVPLPKIAKALGTPAYVYSHATLSRHFQVFDQAFSGIPHLICYSMKCNSNLSLLRIFSELGGGTDIVSGGELYRVLKAGGDPRKVVFSGVGKTEEEIAYALQKKILMFNVESAQELEAIDRVARKMKRRAPIALRVNPNIDPKTHPYITTGMKQSKFGIQYEEALELYARARAMRGIEVVGIDCHIGSQLTEVQPFIDALRKVVDLIRKLERQNLQIRFLDLGGGLGIRYDDELPPSPAEYAEAIRRELKNFNLTLIFEPGRVLMGNAGVLLTRLLYTKDRDDKRFDIVDAAMNDLIRPAFYESYHEILPVAQRSRPQSSVDVVGPICESGDFFAKDRKLPEFEPGELMALMSAGAYGFSMASNYNTRPRACEVLVKGNKYFVIRRRETWADLIRGENIPPELKKAGKPKRAKR